jgi:membrane-associated phospholipid phosphatase
MTSADSREQPRARSALQPVSSRLPLTLLAVPLMLTASAFVSARAQSDTTGRPIGLFTYRDIILAGAVTIGALLVRPLDEHVARLLRDSSTQSNEKLHKLATFVRTTAAPGSYIIGTSMYVTGRVAKNEHLAQLGLYGTESLIVGEIVGGVLKGFVGRQRPYVEPQDPHSFGFLRGFGGGDQYHSFPSGHSLAAFAAAAAVSSQTSEWWPNTRWIIGPTLFSGAALVGLSRIYDNKHWATDVIVGAGLGTFAGLKVIRYHDIHSGTRFENWLIGGRIVPTGDGGHSLHWSLLPGVPPSAMSHTP